MSNQRRGNWKPAALNDGDKPIREIIALAESAQETLEIRGEDEPTFYFEQVVG